MRGMLYNLINLEVSSLGGAFTQEKNRFHHCNQYKAFKLIWYVG